MIRHNRLLVTFHRPVGRRARRSRRSSSPTRIRFHRPNSDHARPAAAAAIRQRAAVHRGASCRSGSTCRGSIASVAAAPASTTSSPCSSAASSPSCSASSPPSTCRPTSRPSEAKEAGAFEARQLVVGRSSVVLNVARRSSRELGARGARAPLAGEGIGLKQDSRHGSGELEATGGRQDPRTSRARLPRSWASLTIAPAATTSYISRPSAPGHHRPARQKIAARGAIDHFYVALPPRQHHPDDRPARVATSREMVDIRWCPTSSRSSRFRRGWRISTSVPVINVNDVPLQGSMP